MHKATRTVVLVLLATTPIASGCSSSSGGVDAPSDGGLDTAIASGDTRTGPVDTAPPSPGDGAPPIGCATTGTTALPAGAPVLPVGVWTNVSPKGVAFHGGGDDVFTQGVTIDPCNAATLYLGVCGFKTDDGNVGLYKSTDAGATWRKIGKLDEPIHVRVNPRDPKHLYAADGVRGGTMGFWVSHDGGESWTVPAGFAAVGDTHRLFQIDVYDVAADPRDFNHVLVTSHSPWDGFGKYPERSYDSGILESKDGGETWIVHEPQRGWSQGNGIWFLRDSSTWLLGTQDGGYFRTANAGATWSVATSEIKMQHGGGGLYRAKSGNLYAGGVPHLMKSVDDGVSWTAIGPYSGFNTVIGDGTNLYSGPVGGPHFVTAREADDTNWVDYPGGPTLPGGPFEMAYDEANHIVYAASWTSGLWALKVK
jgi:hypothetical protein